MAKGIMCAECCYLDKTRKQNSNNGTSCFCYGCNARTHDKFICGWIRNDNELKTMGCSDCNKIKVGTSFCWMELIVFIAEVYKLKMGKDI